MSPLQLTLPPTNSIFRVSENFLSIKLVFQLKVATVYEIFRLPKAAFRKFWLKLNSNILEHIRRTKTN